MLELASRGTRRRSGETGEGGCVRQVVMPANRMSGRLRRTFGRVVEGGGGGADRQTTATPHRVSHSLSQREKPLTAKAALQGIHTQCYFG